MLTRVGAHGNTAFTAKRRETQHRTLDAREELQMLLHGELVEQRVELRTVPQQPCASPNHGQDLRIVDFRKETR